MTTADVPAATPRRRRIFLDASRLPQHAFGSSDLLWWGTAGFVAIEGTMFAMVFATVFYLRSIGPWPPPPYAAPDLLWGTVNTLVLFASSATLRRAVRAIGAGDATTLTRGLAATTLLGAGFLAGQAWAWHDLLRAGVTMEGAYGTVFYWLTGLHAAHVLGGLIFLAVCQARALLGRYTRDSHLGVELCEIYWHFLGAVWLVLVALLFALL